MAASPIYNRVFKPLARRLVRRFNQDGLDVIVQAVTPNVDPFLPPTTVSTETRYEAVASGVSAELRASDPVLSNCIYKVIIDAEQGYTPEADTNFKIDGRAGLIRRVEPIPAMGPICAYRFYVEA